MDKVRPLTHSDLPGVADVFQRVFKRSNSTSSESLVEYLKSLFLEYSSPRPGIHSYVYIKPDGAIGGFIGAVPLTMELNDTRIHAAIGSSLMVDDHVNNPHVGARLLRAFLSGPQDISVGETASDRTLAMWLSLRGIVLPSYSLEWFRLIRPASFIVDLLATQHPALRLLSPFSRGLDALVCNRRKDQRPRWFGVSSGSPLPGGRNLLDKDVDDETMCDLVSRFTANFRLHPHWTRSELLRMLSDAARKTDYGDVTQRVVTSRNGRPVGAFIYHGRPGRRGYVLQVLASPGQEGPVIDRLIGHAAKSGIAALQGRTQPSLLTAMLTRRCTFAHMSSTVVHARDPSLLKPFIAGEAFFNGLAGESWTRLIGDQWVHGHAPPTPLIIAQNASGSPPYINPFNA
jgi:hypothetical protein